MLRQLARLIFVHGLFTTAIAIQASDASCVPGRYYCGTQHAQVVQQSKLAENTTIYLCDDDGASLLISHSCYEGCQSVENGDGFCLCKPNKHYCGHEMNDFRIEQYDVHSLYKCDESGTYVNLIGKCQLGCKDGSPSLCYQMCTEGKYYCGSYLKELGWQGIDIITDNLYQCVAGGANISLWTRCSEGCGSHRCMCRRGELYCGRELYRQLGWMIMKDRLSVLYQCASNGARAFHKFNCNECIEKTTTATCDSNRRSAHDLECQPSRCDCAHSYHYCGYDLTERGWRGIDNRTIYECDGGEKVEQLKLCDRSCVPTQKSAFCGGECVSGEKYCGSLLHQMGYLGYVNESLYLCKNAHSPLIDTGEANIHCRQKCTSGRNYCGYEIQHIHNTQITALAERFVCQADGSFKSVAVCSTCINSSSGAYCSCIPGWRYCGRFTTGWHGSVETDLRPSVYANDIIFRCKDVDELEYVETCPQHECSNDYKNAHCLCSANRTYCGHELYEHYNSADTYLQPHYIYKCSKTRQSVIEEQRCINCIRLGWPTCRQECIVGGYYCGSDLLLLEGWQNRDVDTDSLYKCDNTATAQQIMHCSTGCISASGHYSVLGNFSVSGNHTHDAYCAGPTAPWYKLFVLIGILTAGISLVLFCVRISRYHWRVLRSIEAQRIDAKQLKTGDVLGNGEFGVVLQATYKPKEGKPVEVAIKISHGKMSSAAKLACANCFLQEVIALDILKHRNIIKAFGICTNYKDQMNNTVSALVLEHMNGGSAICYLRSERHRLSGCDLLRILTDISHGGEHLCKMGIIHRDIAARNVLVRENPHTGRAKLAKLTDFGLAKDIGKLTSNYKSVHPERNIFHCRYTAPECFRGEFSSKSDVWSFAVLMWELYTVLEEDPRVDSSAPGPVPYSEICEPSEVLEEVRCGLKLKQPQTAPLDIYRKMVLCWDKTPDARPSFKDLVSFFNSKHGGNEIQLVVPSPPSPEVDDENLRSAETLMQAHDQHPSGYSKAY